MIITPLWGLMSEGMKIARSRPRLLPLLPPLLGGRPAAPAFGALSWAGMLVTLVRYINDGNM